MKRAQLNLVLLGVAGALGAAVYFSQKKEDLGPPLTPFTADTLTSIRVEHPGQPAIALEKKGSAWHLTEPVAALADSVEVGGLLNVASQRSKLKLAAGSYSLTDLGLEPPQYSLSFNGQKLDIGAVEPIEYRRYVKAGAEVLLVDDPPSAALDADYSDLVDKQLIPAGAQVQSIAVPGLSIARAADGKAWQLMPENAAAGSDQKQKLVDAWTGARAMWNGALEADAQGEPITITLKDGRLDFLLIARDPQLVLARPDLKVKYTLSKALADELLKLPEEPKPEAPAPETKS